MKIVIAGGGTGGHIFPAIAIANAIKQMKPDTEILFVGAKGKMEMDKVPQAGFNINGLDIAGFDRGSVFKNFSLPYKLIKSFLQVRSIFKSFQPNAAVGVGGYSSFPVLRFAQQTGIPTFIHESNSFAGKSNILLGKKAAAVFTATDGMQQFFPQSKIIVTGNPVRKTIVNSTVTKQEALKFFNLKENRKTILAVGGSLGAKSINEAIAAHIHEFKPLNLQVIWQTGKATSAVYLERGKPWDNVWVSEFITDIDKAYAAADVVIARAGAMTVAELCVARKPVIFIPYPFAAEDHQTVNARYLVQREAALMIPDTAARTKLFSTLIDLANNDTLQQKLINNIGQFAITNAAEKIAREIRKKLGQ